MSLRIQVGASVFYQDKTYVIAGEPNNFQYVLLKDGPAGNVFRAPIHELSKVPDATTTSSEIINRPLDSVDAESLKTAQKRYAIIKPLLEDPGNKETVRNAALKNDVSVATIYRWMNRFKASDNIGALVDCEGRGGKGKHRISDKVSGVIHSIFEKEILNGTTFKQTYIEIKKTCRNRKYGIPSENTVRNFFKRLGAKARISRIRGPRTAGQIYDPVPGTNHEEVAPLHWVEMDHTEADVMLVDEETGEVIGRPWVTIVLDVFSRMVLGFYASFQSPGCFGTGAALVHAMLPKEKLLMGMGLDPELWPCWGKFVNVRCDNAGEFKSDMLKRASHYYEMNFEFRTPGKPRHGAFIERWMGTFAERLKNVRGSTNVSKEMRSRFKPEKNASLTLPQFNEWMTLMILTYNHEVHSGIGMAPMQKWHSGFFNEVNGIGFPDRLDDSSKRIRLDFMPHDVRCVCRTGVRINHIFYYDDVLINFIHTTDEKGLAKKYIFKKDPRDISKIYFLNPDDKQYYRVPYRKLTGPAMSTWELDSILKQIRADGKEITEQLIFDLYERRRSLEQNAEKTTKKNRKLNAMKKTLAKEKAEKALAVAPIMTVTKTTSEEKFDTSDIDIKPFEIYDNRSFK